MKTLYVSLGLFFVFALFFYGVIEHNYQEMLSDYEDKTTTDVDDDVIVELDLSDEQAKLFGDELQNRFPEVKVTVISSAKSLEDQKQHLLEMGYSKEELLELDEVVLNPRLIIDYRDFRTRLENQADVDQSLRENSNVIHVKDRYREQMYTFLSESNFLEKLDLLRINMHLFRMHQMD